VTNAHVVHRAVSVLVRATRGPPVKYSARVVSVGLPCDLAVLSVEAGFWSGKVGDGRKRGPRERGQRRLRAF